jgi:hypothetical protein
VKSFPPSRGQLGWFSTARIDRAPPSIEEFDNSCVRGRRVRRTNQAAPKPLFLRIPPIPVVLGELGFRRAAWFFEQQHLKVLEAEPGWIGEVVVVEALQFREHVTQGLLQFLLSIGTHSKWLIGGLTEALDGVGGAGAEDFGVRLES